MTYILNIVTRIFQPWSYLSALPYWQISGLFLYSVFGNSFMDFHDIVLLLFSLTLWLFLNLLATIFFFLWHSYFLILHVVFLGEIISAQVLIIIYILITPKFLYWTQNYIMPSSYMFKENLNITSSPRNRIASYGTCYITILVLAIAPARNLGDDDESLCLPDMIIITRWKTRSFLRSHSSPLCTIIASIWPSSLPCSTALPAQSLQDVSRWCHSHSWNLLTGWYTS